jgi:hypothetical protein
MVWNIYIFQGSDFGHENTLRLRTWVLQISYEIACIADDIINNYNLSPL